MKINANLGRHGTQPARACAALWSGRRGVDTGPVVPALAGRRHKAPRGATCLTLLYWPRRGPPAPPPTAVRRSLNGEGVAGGIRRHQDLSQVVDLDVLPPDIRLLLACRAASRASRYAIILPILLSLRSTQENNSPHRRQGR